MKVGTSELLVIFIVALLVLGPEKIPKYAKQAGKFLGSIKVYADKLSEDINESVVKPLEEVKKPLKEAVEPLSNIADDINKPIKDINKSVKDIGKTKKKEALVSGAEEENNTSASIKEVQESSEIQETKISQEG